MDASHTAQHICDDFNRVVQEYQLHHKKIVCVTDSAPNMVLACRLIGNYRVPCIAHKINTLIQKDMLQNPSMTPIRDLLSKIRDGQKKLMYRFDELNNIKEQDIQNRFALLLNEISEMDDICSAENQYINDDMFSNAIQSVDRSQSKFNGLKSLSNIRFCCLYKLSKSYKENASTIKKALENIEKYELIMNRNSS